MAEMTDMLKKMEKAADRHEKIRGRMEALRKQLLEEEKAMQREKDRVNGKWMKKFAGLLEVKGINVYELDPGKVADMVLAAPEDFCLEGVKMEARGEKQEPSVTGSAGCEEKTAIKDTAVLAKEEP